MAKKPKARKQLARCAICASKGNDRVPGRHSHHVKPLEYGGPEDGEQVNLCETHHNEFHRLAEAVFKKKYDLDAVQNRTVRYMLVEYLDQRRKFTEGNVSAVDARRRIQVGFDEDELEQAHFVKIDRGFTSLEAMIKALIIREYQRITSGR